eukprot:sb/3477804/
MQNCAIDSCTGELCNDDTFSMMSAGAVGVVASVMVMVVTIFTAKTLFIFSYKVHVLPRLILVSSSIVDGSIWTTETMIFIAGNKFPAIKSLSFLMGDFIWFGRLN